MNNENIHGVAYFTSVMHACMHPSGASA